MIGKATGKNTAVAAIIGAAVGGTAGARIGVSSGWVKKRPGDFGLVIHELVHVIQDYRGGGVGWVTEGIASMRLRNCSPSSCITARLGP